MAEPSTPSTLKGMAEMVPGEPGYHLCTIIALITSVARYSHGLVRHNRCEGPESENDYLSIDGRSVHVPTMARIVTMLVHNPIEADRYLDLASNPPPRERSMMRAYETLFTRTLDVIRNVKNSLRGELDLGGMDRAIREMMRARDIVDTTAPSQHAGLARDVNELNGIWSEFASRMPQRGEDEEGEIRAAPAGKKQPAKRKTNPGAAVRDPPVKKRKMPAGGK